MPGSMLSRRGLQYWPSAKVSPKIRIQRTEAALNLVASQLLLAADLVR
jgi:hypothetical protein